MTNFRFVSAGFLLAVTAILILISLGFSRVFILAMASLIVGLGAALFLAGRHFRPVRRREPDESNREPIPGDLRPPLDSSAELLNAMLNEMREGLLVINQEMRVVASNRAARELFLNLDNSISSRPLTELTRNPAIYDAFLEAIRGTERAGVKVETYGQTKRVFDLRVVPLRSANGHTISGAVGVFFDVTTLERLEIVRQEFLSNVSHELRTPLTSIIALAETLEAGAIDDTENNRRFLSMIQKNATRMHRLIDDILELSAIEAGNVKVSPELISLRPLVEDVITSLSAAAAARIIVLNNLVASDAQVFADPHRLVQMLTNLIDNAIKFNRDSGIVTIRSDTDERYRIRVEDTGEGIPAHHLDRLFERFYRADRARSRELGGTGLGLAIVKHLAKAHGGEVKVESRFGEGTSFIIELPRHTENTVPSIGMSAGL